MNQAGTGPDLSMEKAAKMNGEFNDGELDAEYFPALRTKTPHTSPAYLPSKRRRFIWDPIEHKWTDYQLQEWKKRLGLKCKDTNSNKIIKKTFLATTQLVPSVQHENHEVPKEAKGTRFPILNCLRLK